MLYSPDNQGVKKKKKKLTKNNFFFYHINFKLKFWLPEKKNEKNTNKNNIPVNYSHINKSFT